MNLNSLTEKQARLAAEVSSLEQRLQELAAETQSVQAKWNVARGGLAVLSELEAEQNDRSSETLLQFPGLNLRTAIHKAAGALKKFTLREIEEWIRSKYPHLKFKAKSIYFPMDDLVAAGKVVTLRRRNGKMPAVYEFKEQARRGDKKATP